MPSKAPPADSVDGPSAASAFRNGSLPAPRPPNERCPLQRAFAGGSYRHSSVCEVHRSMTRRVRPIGAALLALSLCGCAQDTRADVEATTEDVAPSDRVVAIVRTRTLQWEGEQTYIPLYADGSASGLVVVNFDGGLLYGTSTPNSWTWLHRDTIEICASVNILRNEVGFPPTERQCAPHPISGKELDLTGDGSIDLIETFTVVHPLFHKNRPRD